MTWFRKAAVAGTLAATLVAGCSPSAPAPTISMVPSRVNNAADVGPLSATEPMTLVIGTKLQNQEQLDATLATIRAGGSRLSPAEFGDRFGLDADSYADLVAWAQANGLTVVRTTPSRTTLTVSGPASAIENALSVQMRRYADSQGEFYAPSHNPDLGSGATQFVSTIVGLSNARKWHSHMTRDPGPHAATIPTPFPMNGYGPADLRTLFNASKTATATGEHIAILGAGAPKLSNTADQRNTPAMADLTQYLGAAPAHYTQVQVGASGAADPGDDDTLVENTLDAEMVLTFAPDATVDHVLVVTNAPGLFADGISFIVNDASESSARAVSVSYGTCESFAASEAPLENALLAQALAQGQQWFFASGDNGIDGCNDGANSDIPTIDWPASSPYALGVGGTGIYLDSSKNDVQSAWGDGDDTPNPGGAAGGGPSALFAKPSFQTAATPADGARDVPDIAALAAYPGIDVIVGGMDNPTYGTSAATPMWAGIWGMIDHKSNGGKGFTQGAVNLYTAAPTGGIVDITGNNNDVGTKFKGYSAGTGYDMVTGLGVPDVTKLVAQKGWQ